MFQLDGKWIFSTADLVAESECKHRSTLRFARENEVIDIPPEPLAGMARLASVHGIQHEARVLEILKAERDRVVEIDRPDMRSRASIERARQETVEAMRSGVDVIYQAVFFDGEFLGIADFVCMEGGNDADGWRYEVWETKLSLSPKPKHLLQLGAYSQQIAELGFPFPESMHLWHGNGEFSHHKVTNVLPDLHDARIAIASRLAQPAWLPSPLWGDKITACGHCPFSKFCHLGREEDRDLSLVFNIRSTQRRALEAVGTFTIDGLAVMSDSDRPPKIGPDTFRKLREQARLQVRQDGTRTESDPQGFVFHGIFSNEGLDLMPPQSDGDVWFDMEGDPYALQGRGLEYLFGAVTVDEDGKEIPLALWGHTVEGERAAFEEFVDFVESRRRRWPDLHVYHYADYERKALKRLKESHGTRQAQIDAWLEHNLLVDLEKVVQKSVRVSQRSYSLKKLEPLYGLTRTQDVQTAADSVEDYEAYLDLRARGQDVEAQRTLDAIDEYNKVDCISTLKLDRWLRSLSDDKLPDSEQRDVSRMPSPPNASPLLPSEEMNADASSSPFVGHVSDEDASPYQQSESAADGPSDFSTAETSRMPTKLVACRSTDATRSELFIVEGDSALGTAKWARNSEFQALLPIRGTILNVQKSSLDDMLKNAECTAIIQVIGAGSGRSFDLASARYQKIILMSDADVDGAHIRCLLLTVIHRYLPELLADGRVFAAVPPLHRIDVMASRKTPPEVIYTYSDAEMRSTLAALEKAGRRWRDPIQRYRGLGEIDASQLRETTMDPRTRRLRRITVGDAVTADETFTLLMGSDVLPRRDFLVEGADELDRGQLGF